MKTVKFVALVSGEMSIADTASREGVAHVFNAILASGLTDIQDTTPEDRCDDNGLRVDNIEIRSTCVEVIE